MQSRIFQPTDGAGQWPVVLVIHEGGFKAGGFYSGGVEQCAKDLRNNGYYALIVNYRLAPCGLINGQEDHSDPLSGRPVEQTNDIKALVRAARQDSHCLNAKVGVVGGSAGASHAVFVALDKTPTTPPTDWPKWKGSDRVDAAVGLSGPYDYSDREDATTQVINIFENYTNTCVRVAQKAFSPVAVGDVRHKTDVPYQQ